MTQVQNARQGSRGDVVDELDRSMASGCAWLRLGSSDSPTMIGATPCPARTTALRRLLRELEPVSKKLQLDLGLSLDAVGNHHKLEDNDFGSWAGDEEPATVRGRLLADEANRLPPSRIEPG